MSLALNEVCSAMGARVVSRGVDRPLAGVSIDSRTIQAGEWFVAIPGPHFDGHHFIAAALAKGAAGLVVQRPVADLPKEAGSWVLQVTDTIAALGALAARWRAIYAAIPAVAITGSNGKSTTKEMIASVVGARGPVLKTEGNFNNLIGLPLSLFRWTPTHRTAVLELGMSAAGEIAALTTILQPDVGLITNVTVAHLETLQSIDNVAAAKGELFATMRRDGTIIVNAEDPWVRAAAEAYPGRRITCGMGNQCDVRFGRMESPDLATTHLTLYVQGRECAVTLPVPGTHNVMNAMAATAVGLALEIAVDEIMARLPHFTPMKMRMERVQLENGVQVINDSYNANPESMQMALRTVAAAKRAGRFMAVLGDMLELGPATVDRHRELGERAVRAGVDRLFVMGAQARAVADGARGAGLPEVALCVAPQIDALQAAVAAEARSGDIVLVKGSRGMQMERVVEFLKQQFGVG